MAIALASISRCFQGDIPDRRFPVLPPDPHRFDGNDDDGVGCES